MSSRVMPATKRAMPPPGAAASSSAISQEEMNKFQSDLTVLTGKHVHYFERT